MKHAIKYLLKIYQKTSVYLFGMNCRYYPSCSYYYKESLEEYGIIKGSWLGFKRILRCNQLFTGGYDPVPIKRS